MGYCCEHLENVSTNSPLNVDEVIRVRFPKFVLIPYEPMYVDIIPHIEYLICPTRYAQSIFKFCGHILSTSTICFKVSNVL